MAELEAEVTRLTGLVASANADKQRALTEMRDKHLWELAKLESSKATEIQKLKKKSDDAEKKGFKEGEAVYIQQCEAAKDLFFKCGWRSAVEQLGCGPETEVYNAPQYFIPASLVEYAADLQKQFLEASNDDDEENEPTDAPVDNVPANQSLRLEPVVEDVIIEQPAKTELQAETELPIQTVIPSETGLRVDAELDVEIDDLFS
ncbi:uncharacterized protein LOC114315329 [Camellia sinensis]|uniref:uncharacterized protein LOC114315329 n=1 Tax=Camellia sinensis TaxID=4442 RepID=UPI001035DAE7|nr:uncharacterized protein LOC114315329 [Camellia sinensis]